MYRLGYFFDIAVYDVFIGGFSKSEDVEKVLYLYLKMKNYGIFFDVGIFIKFILFFREEKVMV